MEEVVVLGRDTNATLIVRLNASRPTLDEPVMKRLLTVPEAGALAKSWHHAHQRLIRQSPKDVKSEPWRIRISQLATISVSTRDKPEDDFS